MPSKRDFSLPSLAVSARRTVLPRLARTSVRTAQFVTLAIPLTLIACGDKGKSASSDEPQTSAKENPPRRDEERSDQPGRSEADAKKRVPGTFEPGLTKEFLSWTPVLAGDVAFKSRGHGGITVRSYLNPVAAAAAAKPSDPYPLAVGSILAKAVVANASSPASSASRVYFMRKEAAGFDPENGDWSYGLANRSASGSLELDSSVKPREDLCVSCHTRFARFDYAQTVDFYRRQSTLPAP